MSNEKIRIQKLDWDTEYFGIECARVDLTKAVKQPEFLTCLSEVGKYDLIYIFNHGCDTENNALIAKHTDAFLADTNVQFLKKISSSIISCEEIQQEFSIHAADYYPEDELILYIAEHEYHQSRFMTDKRLEDLGGNHIYSEWVRSSFNKPNKFFLADKNGGKTRGFILFSICEKSLTVELIGTAKEAQRMGVGKRLWHAAEHEATLRGCDSIQVGTQLSNMNACNFYFGCGCCLNTSSQIYHWWK